MRLADKVLVHQAHPAKIGADVTASVVSNVLLWREQPKTAVAVRILVSVAGSAAVLSLADLDTLAETRHGRYVLEHMPPSAQAIRLAGDALMGFGAHRRSRALLLAGAAVIVVGWVACRVAVPPPARRSLERQATVVHTPAAARVTVGSIGAMDCGH